jgi:hypothetical protein
VFTTGDQPRNVAWLALLFFDEAWHNNHHAFPPPPDTGSATYGSTPARGSSPRWSAAIWRGTSSASALHTNKPNSPTEGRSALWKEIPMAILFKKEDKVDEEDSPGRSSDWYADPYGEGARRFFDKTKGWTDQVEGVGEKPDKTGLARMDEAAESTDASSEHVDADGEPAKLSRPVDAGMLGQA